MSKSRQFSRRQFLQTSAAVAGGVAAATLAGRASIGAVPSAEGGFRVSLRFRSADAVAASAPAQWALNHLRDVLTAKGAAVTVEKVESGTAPAADITVHVAGGPAALGGGTPGKASAAEALSLRPGESAGTIMANGDDPLGLVYALTELADRVTYAGDLEGVKTSLIRLPVSTESPAAPIRSLFRMYASQVEDDRWFHDRTGWQKYFDTLVTNRFNRFNLSFGLSYDFSTGLTDTYTFFMYPFFVNVPNYNVRALAKNGQPIPAEEMAKNLDTLKFISDQCALRGLQFNLGIWTHNYRWTNSPNATHTIDGLNPQTQAPYSRDAMKMILAACPGITGITLRTHGESGVPEGSYDLWKIIMSGITGHKNADGTPRILELDMHAKTMTQEMIDTAHTTGMPVTISCKFWAEHMGLPYVQSSIREAEMPKGRDATGLMALSSGTRSFLRYGIGDLLRKDRNYKVIHRVWPGTQRLLLWGDPLYAAEYGRAASFAGMDGIEYFEPLSFRGRAGSSMNIPAAPDRSGYADASLRAEHDWEKYTYTFRLWGRLSYNPDAAPETWQRQLKSKFGSASAPHLESVLATASRILPLITTSHLPAAANAQYWPEIYVNQSIVNPNGSPYSEAPNPKVFGNVSSLDPQLFASVNEYVDSLLAAKPLAKVSPLDVARQLDTWAASTIASIDNVMAPYKSKDPIILPATSPKNPIEWREVADAAIATGLGQFFAHKFRAAILWQLFNLSAHEPARTAATDSYKKASNAWAALTDIAKIYLPDLTFGTGNLHGHWSDRLPDIDADIAAMAARNPPPRNPAIPGNTIDALIAAVLAPAEKARAAAPRASHDPAKSFTPNQPLEIGAHFDDPGITSVQLRYRRLHQGETYKSLPVEPVRAANSNLYRATIPADFTNSPFPLQYYFEIRTEKSATLFPGFKENFTGTPYFVIQSA